VFHSSAAACIVKGKAPYFQVIAFLFYKTEETVLKSTIGAPSFEGKRTSLNRAELIEARRRAVRLGRGRPEFRHTRQTIEVSDWPPILTKHRPL